MTDAGIVFSSRPVIFVNLPLDNRRRILPAEQVVVKIGPHCHDLGALCYSKRSTQKRKPGEPLGVVLSTFLSQRPKQILQLIKVLSAMFVDAGSRALTVKGMATYAKIFVDWADSAGYHDCLAGGTATRVAFRAYVDHVELQHRRYELRPASAARLQSSVCTLLELITGATDLGRGLRFVRKGATPDGGTQPAAEHGFAHSLALNRAIFDGLTELVVNVRPYPFKLQMPESLKWEEAHLWVFPAAIWHLAPHLRGPDREKLGRPNWVYNYGEGRVATVDELWYHYQPRGNHGEGVQRWEARRSIENTTRLIAKANETPRHHRRIEMAMTAHNAFVFLFLANTGCNLAVAQQIEIDGEIDTATLNQRYRSIKFRAQGQITQVVCPAAFMPSLRLFMKLRSFVLDGRDYPFLFFTLGRPTGKRSLSQLPNQVLQSHYLTLRRIDTGLPRIMTRTIRATVEDYYHQKEGADVAAVILGHSNDVAEQNYRAGSPVHHREDLSLFLNKVSASAKTQRVSTGHKAGPASRHLEEGGECEEFGAPEAFSPEQPSPVCLQGGCMLCYKRVLVANEEDARKIASAAFVMEQLVLGPLSESQFRPLIHKCDQDLEKIAGVEGCTEMVARVRREVYEDGILTPYFERKFQLFLDLGVLN